MTYQGYVEYANWTPEMHRVNKECNTLRFATGALPYKAPRLSEEDRRFRLRFLPLAVLLTVTACADRHNAPGWAWDGYVSGNEAGGKHAVLP